MRIVDVSPFPSGGIFRFQPFGFSGVYVDLIHQTYDLIVEVQLKNLLLFKFVAMFQNKVL